MIYVMSMLTHKTIRHTINTYFYYVFIFSFPYDSTRCGKILTIFPFLVINITSLNYTLMFHKHSYIMAIR